MDASLPSEGSETVESEPGRLSSQAANSGPWGRSARSWKDWLPGPPVVSSFTVTGRFQLVPPSNECAMRTSVRRGSCAAVAVQLDHAIPTFPWSSHTMRGEDSGSSRN